MIKFFGWRGSGKTFSIIQRAYRLAKRGKKVLILVPTKTWAENIRERLEESTNIDVKVFGDYDTSNYDAVLVDEISLCVNHFFDSKVDCISESLNDDYVTKGF